MEENINPKEVVEETFNPKKLIEEHRAEIKKLASNILKLKGVFSEKPYPAIDKGELMANLTLAYRHLEDSSMRLGKAIQAYDGGKSVYDKNTVVGA
jgi:hypothetical protein